MRKWMQREQSYTLICKKENAGASLVLVHLLHAQ
jgi:hypothetical protein